MVKPRKSVIVAAVLGTAVVLAGCNGSPETASQTASAATGSAPPSAASSQGGSLVASGFGQQDEFVFVTSLVKNTTDSVGQTVSVLFNVYGAGEELLASETQVEAFTTPDQELAVGTQISLEKKQKAARIEATLLVEDSGAFSSEPGPVIPTGPVKLVPSEYSSKEYVARYEISNPTAEVLKNPRVGVICFNADQKVIGGGSEYPNLIAPSGKIVANTSLIVNGKPASCTAYASSGF